LKVTFERNMTEEDFIWILFLSDLNNQIERWRLLGSIERKLKKIKLNKEVEVDG